MSTNHRFAVAVHVLTLLGTEPDGIISSVDMAASTNANPVYVRRVLGPLRRAGLVTSCVGVHGGWRLARRAEEITLGDVWRATHGAEPILELHAANPACGVGRHVERRLGAIDRRIAAAAEAELDRATLLDLLPRAGAPRRAGRAIA